jgi:mannose-6-phosphate isomerase-like protein (cupin superfamily)
MASEPIVLPPGGGRTYEVGPMRGVFKADGPETGNRYCASEWTLAAHAAGPGPHHHEANEEVFLVTRGTLRFLVGSDWLEAPAGTFLRIPAGVTHDFENCGAEPATAFNVFLPGGFEAPFSAWLARRAAPPPGPGSAAGSPAG